MEAFVKILLGVALIAVVRQNSRVRCQAISMPAPECYNTVTCPCCSVTCPTDGSGQCSGNCKDGYHGGKCWSKCPENCIRCVDAQQGGVEARCTLCKDGYYSTAALYQCQLNCFSNCKTCESSAPHCTSCNHGLYINEFHQCAECIAQCETCTSLTNCTSCKRGFYNIKTTATNCNKCNSLCYTCNSSETCFCSNGCLSGSSTSVEINCDLNTNECRFGCRFNFTSNYNNYKCDKCTDGNYGIECDLQCPVNCRPPGCNRIDGDCYACSNGFHGDFCNQPCPVNCGSNMCDKVTGHCVSCSSGYFGKECDQNCVTNCYHCLQTNGSCTRCKEDMFYGVKCTKKCPPNCIDDKCNMTGHCDILSTITNPPTTTVLSVVPQESTSLVGPVAGGTVAAVLVVAIMVVLAVVFVRRRRSMTRFKGDFNVINLDNYNFRLTDVLEENDEFDSTYFSCKDDDKRKPCGKLPVKELAKFVDTHGDEFYQEEFLKLPRGLIKPCEDAKLEKNILKNRYNGVYPYDEHRVKLIPPGSDFINACYIDGFKKKKEYIASIGPTRKVTEGFHSFWMMVWQEKTDIIVMITNLMEGQSLKCEQYWPVMGQSCSYGDITVTSHSTDFFSDFDVRKLTMSRGKEHRTVHHLHYTAWPEKHVPDDISSLLEFRQKVKATESSLGGPTIVHCSAGIGRTGTYIALDILIHQGRAQKSLDIFKCVTRMRDQRTSMVQTWQQYEFLHRALVYALTFYCEPFKKSKFQRDIGSLTEKHLQTLFKQLEKPEKPAEGETEARTINKGYEGLNREGADNPGLLNRPLLRHCKCNYINAVYLNSYTVKDRFLICQTPLPNTVEDFLALITQESCSCIVSMDPPGVRDPTIGDYFSRRANKTFDIPSGLYEVETQELRENPSYILRKLIIRHNQGNSESTSLAVYHYQCKHWPQEDRVPEASHLLQLVLDVDAVADRDADRGHVLVHCLNAAERSGLFCAVSNLVQKIKVEGEVSLVNTLRQVKVRRPLAIPNKEQIQFCYQVVQQFLTRE